MPSPKSQYSLAMALLSPTSDSYSRGWRRRAVAAQVAVAMPELGWSVCEALFMPMLLKLEVPKMLLAVCWLCSPLTGIFLQPCIGRLSDSHGRRPYILAFGILASIGLVATPWSTHLPRKFAIPAAIATFGLTDISHDALTTPTRAAMNDIFDPECSEQRCAVAAGVGKSVALLFAATLPSELAFEATAAAMGLAALMQLIAPSSYPEASGDVCNSEAEISSVGGSTPKGFWLVWSLTSAGWLSVCIFQFYFTSIWAQSASALPGTIDFDNAIHFASLLLMGQVFVFVAVGFVLPHIVQVCRGEIAAISFALCGFVASFASFFLRPMTVAAVATVVVVPICYQVVANVPFSWLERQPGFLAAERGRLTGWMNLSMVFAQATVAISTGPLVHVMNGRLSTTFVAVAGVDIVVLFAAACISCCCLRAQMRTPEISESTVN